METAFRITRLFFFSSIFLLFLGSSPSAAVSSLADGSLIRAHGDDRVYYLEQGKKRWIESAEAFQAQGFRWEDIQTATSDDLALYQDGEAVTPQSYLILPGEENSLSDLVAFPASDLRLAAQNNRTILKFSSIFWNQGKGHLELIADPESLKIAGDVPTNVFQRILRGDGQYRDKYVGNFVWHAQHGHYHYNEFIDYIFESTQDASAPVMQKKSTRCIGDWQPANLSLPGAPQEKLFPNCSRMEQASSRERQGISIGWADRYNYTLADQYLDVHDLPPGIYRLTIIINAANKLVEARVDNNTSIVLFNLDVSKGISEVIVSAGPFGGAQSFPNGMLMRAEGDDKVYVIHANRKRWIRNGTIFNSYGYSWDAIEVFPKSIVEVIAYNNLIRADGTTVYALNDAGYKRPIRNPAVFGSYEFSWNDVADINAVEFAQYPDASFVRVAGDTKVYAIDGDIIEQISPPDAPGTNGFNGDEVHVINAADFADYSLNPGS